MKCSDEDSSLSEVYFITALLSTPEVQPIYIILNLGRIKFNDLRIRLLGWIFFRFGHRHTCLLGSELEPKFLLFRMCSPQMCDQSVTSSHLCFANRAYWWSSWDRWRWGWVRGHFSLLCSYLKSKLLLIRMSAP